MDVLVERCAGLDVHRDTVVATVRVSGKRRGTRRGETRTYPTTIAGLERMADWLSEHEVTLVGMEATGVYWKPVFAVLSRGWSAGCSTPSTCTMCRAVRPTWPTRCGSPN